MIRSSLIRKTDVDRLNAWISANPEKAWAAMLANGLQPQTIERIISGKQRGAPKPMTRRILCNVTGLSESILFPVVVDGKQSA